MREMGRHGVQVLTPTANRIPYSLLRGQPSTVWFNRHDLDPSSPEDTPSVEAAASKLAAALDDAHASLRVPPERVVVGGFSMGGGMALQLGVREAHRNLAGIFAMSSFLNDASPLYAHPALPRSPPIRMWHGGADQMIRAAWGRRTAERLRETGAKDVTFSELPGVHHVMTDAEVVELTEWVCERLGIQ